MAGNTNTKTRNKSTQTSKFDLEEKNYFADKKIIFPFIRRPLDFSKCDDKTLPPQKIYSATAKKRMTLEIHADMLRRQKQVTRTLEGRTTNHSPN